MTDNKGKEFLMRYLAILSTLFLVGCAAQMVTQPTTSKYAPEGYEAKGMIKYLNQGADSIIAKRREDAFKQMHNACGGAYEITKEGESSDGTSFYRDLAGGVSSYSSKYWLMEFKCK